MVFFHVIYKGDVIIHYWVCMDGGWRWEEDGMGWRSRGRP